MQPAAERFGASFAGAGSELGTTAAGVVHMATAPFRALIWGYQQVEEKLLPIIIEKMKKIPQSRLALPSPNIVGATLEASKFALDSPDLVDIFASLIAAASDVDRKNEVHPAFITITQQLTTLDAL